MPFRREDLITSLALFYALREEIIARDAIGLQCVRCGLRREHDAECGVVRAWLSLTPDVRLPLRRAAVHAARELVDAMAESRRRLHDLEERGVVEKYQPREVQPEDVPGLSKSPRKRRDSNRR